MSYRGHSKGNYGLRKIQRVHKRRSGRAKQIDESLRAPTAETPEQWLQQPNRFDFPDVDTPDKVSKEEQNKRLAEIRLFEATHSNSSNHKRFRAKLDAHRLYGNTH